MTKLIKCTCVSVYQDLKYGKQIRLFNYARSVGWRCTVCGKEVKEDKKP